jgi:hypothetical protein
MQSVVSQSSANEKVTQSQHMNQDTLMRHFAIQAEEERAQKRSSVNASKESEKIKQREKDRRRHSKKRGDRHDNGREKSTPDKRKNDIGEHINITV